MKTKLNLKIMILLATIVSLGCSDEKKKESQGVEDGYASPELVFEAIKGNELEFESPLYPPADRNMVAYIDVELLSLIVTIEEDLDRVPRLEVMAARRADGRGRHQSRQQQQRRQQGQRTSA